MNFMRQMVLGHNLTKLSNLMERMEETGATRYAGSGHGFESLPPLALARVEAEIQMRMATLSKHPPHIVSWVLGKHMTVSMQLGREIRLRGQCRLLDLLVANGAALSFEDFERYTPATEEAA